MNPLQKEITIKWDNKIFYSGYEHIIHLSMSNHDIKLKYAGEPPHGDFFFEMYIDEKRFTGYVWGCTIIFPFKQKYIVCHWMGKRFERKTIIINIEKFKFVEMDRYWNVKDIKDKKITFTCYKRSEDKKSKLLTLVASEDDFTEWLDVSFKV